MKHQTEQDRRNHWAAVHLAGDRNAPLPVSWRMGPMRPFWKPEHELKGMAA